MGIFPKFGVNIKNTWNHHLVANPLIQQAGRPVCWPTDLKNESAGNVKLEKSSPQS